MIADAVDTAVTLGWALLAWIVLTADGPEALCGPQGPVPAPEAPAPRMYATRRPRTARCASTAPSETDRPTKSEGAH